MIAVQEFVCVGGCLADLYSVMMVRCVGVGRSC